MPLVPWFDVMHIDYNANDSQVNICLNYVSLRAAIHYTNKHLWLTDQKLRLSHSNVN